MGGIKGDHAAPPDDLAGQLAEFQRYGAKFTRALAVLRARSVKRHRFEPSGREIWTVVGVAGEQLVDEAQPYCSCHHFHYRVLDGQDETCYHLLAVRMARRTGLYDEVRLRDDEHYDLLRYLLRDIARPNK